MNRMFKERDKNNCIYFNNGSYIGSGEHILYGDGRLGYILEIKDKGYISKEHRNACGIGRKVPARAKYALVREFQVTRFGEDEDNNPNPALYPNLPKFLPEATPTATCSYVAVEEVKDIALVFHIDELEAGLKDPGGLHNAFFTFQYRNPGGRLQPLAEYDSFPNPHSFSARVWDLESTLIEEKRKAMGVGGQWDGRVKTAELPGHNISMYNYHSNYISNVKEGEGVICKRFATKRQQKVQLSDLSMENKKVGLITHITRVIDEPALKRARKSLGGRLAVANPSPVPSWKKIKESKGRVKANVPVGSDSVIRMVTCNKDYIDTDRSKRSLPYPDQVSSIPIADEDRESKLRQMEAHKYTKNCRYPGLDLFFTVSETGRTSIDIRSKFKKLKALEDNVRLVAGYRTRAQIAAAREEEARVLAEEARARAAARAAAIDTDTNRARSPPTIVRTVTDTDPHGDVIEVGDPLVYERSTYEVFSVNVEANEVQCVRMVNRDSHPPITLTVAEATHLVTEYQY